MIELVVTDLDRTLWDDNYVVTQTTLDALAELSRRNIPVLAATARNLDSTKELLSNAGLQMDMVLLNGALGKLIDGTPFFLRSIEEVFVEKALAVFEEAEIIPHLIVDGSTYLVLAHRNASSCTEYLDCVRSFTKTVDSLRNELAGHTVLQIGATGLPKSQLEPVHFALLELGLNAYLVPELPLKPGTWTSLVGAGNVSKWNAVIAYCESQGINPANTLAIGDGHNDVEMLQAASIGCALKWGVEEAKAAATYVVDDWAGLLEYVS